MSRVSISALCLPISLALMDMGPMVRGRAEDKPLTPEEVELSRAAREARLAEYEREAKERERQKAERDRPIIEAAEAKRARKCAARLRRVA